MKCRIVSCLATLVLLFPGLILLENDAVGQQAATTHHKYFLKAVFTTDGMKNLQKQTAKHFQGGRRQIFRIRRRQT
jgi:hypothetical protein